MQLNINVQGAENLRKKFGKLNFERALQEEINQGGELIKWTAKQLAVGGYGRPVYQTGYLYNHIRSTYPGTLKALIKSEASYSYFPHEGRGTSKKYGKRPYLDDAAKNQAKTIEKNVARAIDRLFWNL